MRLRPALCLCWLATAAATLGSGCATVKPAPDALEVDRLRIDGAAQVPERELRARIVTSPSPLIGPTEWFDASTWQADLRRLLRVYEAQGYYQARVADDEVKETKPGHVELKVTVTEGARAVVAARTVDGLQAVEPQVAERVLLGLPLAPGEPFVEERWGELKRAVVTRLRAAGYAEALVAGEAVVDPDAATAQLALTVRPGQRLRFGRLFVAAEVGAQVPQKLVASLVEVEVKKGDWFSDDALERAQTRLFNLGVFSAVKVTPGASEQDTATVPVVVDLREAPFHGVRMGGGVSGDLLRQEARVVFEYTHRNLGLARLFSKDAALDKLTAKLKAGYAVMPSLFDLIRGRSNAQHGLIGRALLEYTAPRAFGVRTLSFQSSLELQRTLDAAFSYWGGELKLAFPFQPTAEWSVVPAANLGLYLLDSVVPTFTAAPTATLGCPATPQVCWLGSVDVTVEWDRRDSKLEPTSGTYVGLSVQGGLSQTNTVAPYLRLVPEARGYLSFGPQRRFTLAGKVRLGTILSTTTNTPVVARFFSGGSAMRGFSQRRLSPTVAYAPLKTTEDFVKDSNAALPDATLAQRNADVQAREQECLAAQQERRDDLYCRRFDPGATAPIGGNGLFESSVELRWNFITDFVLAAFVDGGLVTTEPLFQGADWGKAFFLGVGLGLRWRSPIGPLRADVAWRLPMVGGPLERTDVDVRKVYIPPDDGCFVTPQRPQSATYAGAPLNLCALHFSIGEAF